MLPDNLKTEVENALSEFFEGTTLFLVDVQINPTGKIAVFADGQENITIEQCTKISRFLENFLESNGLVGEKYTLEVSSPGMDETLKVPKQFKKCIGREMEVLLKNGQKEIGILTAFSETDINIEIPEQKKKKEIIPAQSKVFTFEDIKNVKKHFVFK
jgi:ribosome maturation factor RimP